MNEQIEKIKAKIQQRISMLRANASEYEVSGHLEQRNLCTGKANVLQMVVEDLSALSLPSNYEAGALIESVKGIRKEILSSGSSGYSVDWYRNGARDACDQVIEHLKSIAVSPPSEPENETDTSTVHKHYFCVEKMHGGPKCVSGQCAACAAAPEPSAQGGGDDMSGLNDFTKLFDYEGDDLAGICGIETMERVSPKGASEHDVAEAFMSGWNKCLEKVRDYSPSPVVGKDHTWLMNEINKEMVVLGKDRMLNKKIIDNSSTEMVDKEMAVLNVEHCRGGIEVLNWVKKLLKSSAPISAHTEITREGIEKLGWEFKPEWSSEDHVEFSIWVDGTKVPFSLVWDGKSGITISILGYATLFIGQLPGIEQLQQVMEYCQVTINKQSK